MEYIVESSGSESDLASGALTGRRPSVSASHRTGEPRSLSARASSCRSRSLMRLAVKLVLAALVVVGLMTAAAADQSITWVSVSARRNRPRWVRPVCSI